MSARVRECVCVPLQHVTVVLMESTMMAVEVFFTVVMSMFLLALLVIALLLEILNAVNMTMGVAMFSSADQDVGNMRFAMLVNALVLLALAIVSLLSAPLSMTAVAIPSTAVNASLLTSVKTIAAYAIPSPMSVPIVAESFTMDVSMSIVTTVLSPSIVCTINHPV